MIGVYSFRTDQGVFVYFKCWPESKLVSVTETHLNFVGFLKTNLTFDIRKSRSDYTFEVPVEFLEVLSDED